MSNTVIYECPDCEDRKLLCHSQDGLHPQMWCSCESDFRTMDIVYESE